MYDFSGLCMISDEDIKEIVEQVTLNLERKLMYKEARSLIRKLYKKLIKYKHVQEEQTISSIYEIDDIVVKLENCITDDYYREEVLNIKMMLANDLDYLYSLGLEDAARETGLNADKIVYFESVTNDLPKYINDLIDINRIYRFLFDHACDNVKVELKKRGFGCDK